MKFRKFYHLIMCFFLMPFHFQARPVAADQEPEHKALSLNSDLELNSLKSAQQICRYLEKKLAGYVDLLYYVEDCKLRLLDDAEVANDLISIQKINLVPLDDETYSRIPLGKNYTLNDYEKQYRPTYNFAQLCQKYEKNTLTTNNIDFYYIQSCQKRKFDGYNAVLNFNNLEFRPILAVAPSELALFHDGKPMVVEIKKEVVNTETDKEIRAHLPPAETLCAKLNRRVVSFYQSFFLVENCKLRPIIDATLEVQEKAANTGGIRELTVQQRLGIPPGDSVSSAEVLKKT